MKRVFFDAFSLAPSPVLKDFVVGHVPGFTYLCRFQYVVLDHQHVLVGQTDVILTPLSDGEHLIADLLPFTGPNVTKLRLLLRLTTQEVSRRLHHPLI